MTENAIERAIVESARGGIVARDAARAAYRVLAPRMRELEAEVGRLRAEHEAAMARLLGDLSRCRELHLRVKEDGEKGWARAKELLVERDEARAELEKRCDLTDCEQFREWLSGEKADADKRARKAEAEAEQLRAEHEAALDDARAEAADLEGLAVDLGVKLKETEAERDAARAQATFLTEVTAGTALLGADDAIGMVRALAQHLAQDGVIGADQAEQVNAGLDKQQADRELLAERLDDVQTRVFQAFIGADADGTDLNAMTSVELTEYVMAAIRSATDGEVPE